MCVCVGGVNIQLQLPFHTYIFIFKVDVKDCGEGSETLGSFFEAKIQRITKVTIT